PVLQPPLRTAAGDRLSGALPACGVEVHSSTHCDQREARCQCTPRRHTGPWQRTTVTRLSWIARVTGLARITWIARFTWLVRLLVGLDRVRQGHLDSGVLTDRHSVLTELVIGPLTTFDRDRSRLLEGELRTVWQSTAGRDCAVGLDH